MQELEYGMWHAVVNSEQLSLFSPDRHKIKILHSQNSGTDDGGVLQASPLTEELLVIDNCYGKENHSFFFLTAFLCFSALQPVLDLTL